MTVTPSMDKILPGRSDKTLEAAPRSSHMRTDLDIMPGIAG
jgi:hypothetical protein